MDWTPQEDFMKKVLGMLGDSFIPDSAVQRNVQENLKLLQQNSEFCSYLLLICESNQLFDDKTRALAGLILKNNIVYLYGSIPFYVKQQMQQKCLAMLSDSSKEVRLSASVLINVMVQKEGIAAMGNVIAVILNLMNGTDDEICEAAMKTLVLVTEDYLNALRFGTPVDATIKGLLGSFVELTEHRSVEVRRWAFGIVNETLQKHYFLVNSELDRRLYLEKLISHAIDEHPQIILAVVQGFVSFVNNQDDTILPAMNDVICYMITKSVDENTDIALQAGEFWMALSKLQLCVGMLRQHLKTLIPILLKNMRKCPKSLLSPLIKIVIDEVRKNCKKDPVPCGFNTSENAYEPLRLMQSVILQVNEICLRYLDNSMLCSLPSPGPPHNLVSFHAIKNTRRKMEDRHVILSDLNTIFNRNEATPSSYYAIFDGHGGQDAAAYSAAHLHQYLAESKYYVNQPEVALTEAFCRTDLLFIEKCKVEINFSGGATAVCALLRPKEKSLFLAWVGDSQAVLARQGLVEQCVHPHKPDRIDERHRIEAMGGSVIYWGTWRVNGQLAVSRAIGDADYKPYISAEPDVREYALDGTEDFLVLACDGLWDVISDDMSAMIVYDAIYENPDIVADTIAHRLVHQAKEKGSTDNISVIVVFLKEPAKIAAEPRREIRLVDERMEAGFDSANAASNPFANTNGADILGAQHQKDAFMLDLDGFRPNNNAHAFVPANGKNVFDEDLDDLGPETDVDAVDEVQSPVKLIPGMSEELEEKVAKEIDANLLKSVVDSNLEHDEDDEHDEEVLGAERKGETPTPPADEVHDAGLDSDSEDDGWNYIKGASDDDKENQPPSEHAAETEQPIETAPAPAAAPPADESEEIDNMSQLNPNAEEFVPVSPTRMEHNRADWLGMKEDQILAQSPRRPNPNCELNVPEENDFVEGVKSRPSEVYSNGHEDNKQSSQEIMENILNGKNTDELEFQPTGSPSKTVASAEQFIFGPNSGAFSTPNKFMDQSRSSTKANYGDESPSSPMDESDLLDRLNKEKDPMSMSFYQDKDDDETPFDVDKEEKDHDEKEQEEPKPFDDSVVTTDLDNKDDFGVCELPKSPLPEEPVPVSTPEPLMLEGVERLSRSSTENSDLVNSFGALEQVPMPEPEPVQMILNASSPLLEFENVSQPEIVSEDADEKKFVTDDEIIERPLEPLAEVGAKSPLPDVIAEEPEVDDFAPHVDVDALPEEASVMHPEPVVCYSSPAAELLHQQATAYEDISECSDIQQQFIPETSMEVAQSPEPVILDFTPDLDAAPVIPEGVHKFAEEPIAEPVVCLMAEPVIAPEVVEIEFTQESVVEQLAEAQFEPLSPVSPVVEQRNLVPESFDAFEKHIDDLMESETPKIVEPVMTLTDISPIADFHASEVAEVITPVEDVTSSIKDDSPMEEIKEIQHELVTAQIEAVTLTPETQELAKTPEIEREPEPEPASAVEVKAESKVAETLPEPQPEQVQQNEEILTAGEVAAVAVTVTTVTVGAGVIAEAVETKKVAAKPKSSASSVPPVKKSMATTKTTAKSSMAAGKAPLATKTTAKPATTAASKAAVPPRTTKSTTATTTAPKAPAKPRVPLTAAAAKPSADKKPLTNGDAKPAPKIPPIRRPPAGTTSATRTSLPKTTNAPTKPTAAPLSAPKPPVTKTTAMLKPAAKTASSTTAAPKPRPTTLSARTTTTTKTTTSRPLSSSTTTTTRTLVSKTASSVSAAPKTKPASAPLSKPRVPLSARTTTARAPDAEKQNKENVNKLTASRTAATKTAAPRKPMTATAATKTANATKTTKLSNKTPTKKPLAKNSNSPSLDKALEEEEEEKIVPNGVSEGEKAKECINEADQLLKDLSPVNNLILDNSQLAEATAD